MPYRYCRLSTKYPLLGRETEFFAVVTINFYPFVALFIIQKNIQVFMNDSVVIIPTYNEKENI